MGASTGVWMLLRWRQAKAVRLRDEVGFARGARGGPHVSQGAEARRRGVKAGHEGVHRCEGLRGGGPREGGAVRRQAVRAVCGGPRVARDAEARWAS